jgi:ABC-type multidrug transport system fused ATPase/permease subunit
VLVLIARIAFALTSDSSSVLVHLGPLPDWHPTVSFLIGLAAVLVVLRATLQLTANILSARAVYGVVNRIRHDTIELYLDANWSLQAVQREGRLQELLTTYTNSAAQAVTALTVAVIAGFNLTAMLLTAVVVSPLASVGAALAALAIGMVLRPLRAAVRRRSARAAAANLEFATGITEASSTLQAVRVFGVEGAVGDRLDTLADRSTQRLLRTAYLTGTIPAMYQGAALLLMVGGLGLAYAAGLSNLASLGAVVLIMLRSLSYAQTAQTGVQMIHEYSPYLQTLQEEQEHYRAAAVPTGGDTIDTIDTIEFDHVGYSYEPGIPVLKDISFRTRRGEVIGIVGPSGSGKSTLVQLLLRLREPTVGTVRADGRDVKELALNAWYQRFALVPQDAVPFSGTVADNIRFFRSEVDEGEIERAAKLAHLHDDVMAWPLGYETEVGGRGHQISGGQRQRLCLARALVGDPDIVVLDEPTSSLDVKSESLVRETLGQLAPHRTVFVIAHRMSTLGICDRIMVILNGELQGFDTPPQLEATNPFYREALRLSGMR